MKRALIVPLLAVIASFAACSQTKEPEPGLPAQTYSDAAAKYNANASQLHQLFAPVTVRIRYDDKDGKEHNEQGEGRLQIVQPDHVALSIGKVGEVFFWLGSDSQRYWWLDLSGKPRAMFVGAHENYEKSQARRIGVVVAPLDLVRLLGIVTLPEQGQLQMSSDGKRIGLVTALDLGARQRTWIDPQTYLPTMIELFNAKGECEVVAALSQPDGVDVKGTSVRPRVNTRVTIAHSASNSQITLDLSDMQDGAGRMVPDAFNPKELAKQLRADKIYDLDAPPKAAASAPAKP